LILDTLDRIALASSSVRVLAEPKANLMPPEELEPGRTVIEFAPKELKLLNILDEVPCPTDMRIMTAATPMTTPRTVKKLLSL
jgi:hypothetical protein